MTAVAELPNGAAGVEFLEATVPCPVPWCPGCVWEFDEVGGEICRSHTWETEQGILLSVIDYPPGDPRNDDINETEPLISMPQPRSDAHSVQNATAMHQSLGLVLAIVAAPGTTAYSSLPVPSWAVGIDYEAGEVQHHRYAYRPLHVTAWLEQVDRLELINGRVSIVREPVTMTISFELLGGEEPTGESEVLPVAVLQDGHWPSFSERVTSDRLVLARDAVRELLAAYLPE